ncbi:hypothetical protein [Herbaspirillum autotrophicum]|nr:hypothetical protein [Herbaspirillum autotrophicum]
MPSIPEAGITPLRHQAIGTTDIMLRIVKSGGARAHTVAQK